MPADGNLTSRAVTIPFQRPHLAMGAQMAVQDVLASGRMESGGPYAERCHALLRQIHVRSAPLLTTSCTTALEMACLLLDLSPGDEVIMPSWSFPSTANAVVLRGATPVFVDVLPDTLCVDPACVAAAIGPRSRAILCVHYAGLAAALPDLLALCEAHGLDLIEDAAHAIGATCEGDALGGFGRLGALSFHGTKNISAGEAGTLLINDPSLISQAEVVLENGTGRLRYRSGEASSYWWESVGSSFLPSEVTAALLAAQLPDLAIVSGRRREAWDRYATLLGPAVAEGLLDVLSVPPRCRHNGHIFPVLIHEPRLRDAVLTRLQASGIDVRSHYRPLHSSPAGQRLGRTVGAMRVTDAAAAGLLRLPLDTVITADEQQAVVGHLVAALRDRD